MRISRLTQRVTRGRQFVAAAGVLLLATAALESAQLSSPPPPPPAPSPQSAQKAADTLHPSDAAVQSPIEFLASRPVVRIMVNGQGPFAFLIDPLAPRVLIDQTLVESLVLKPHQAVAGRTEVQIDLGIGADTLREVVAEVANTTRLVAEFGPAGQPRGVLGAALWRDQLVTIDFSRRQLRIEPGTLPLPNEKDVFALQAPSRDLIVPLVLSGRSLLCRVDPLASHGLVLPARYLDEAPIQRPALRVERIHTRHATVPGKEARVTTKLTIAVFDFVQPIVEFGEIGDVAVVGSRWLGDFALTYDLTNDRVRLGRVPKTN